MYIYTHEIKGSGGIKHGILSENRNDLAKPKLPQPPGTDHFQQGITAMLRIWPKSSNGESPGMAS